jgi:hypothetical protein
MRRAHEELYDEKAANEFFLKEKLEKGIKRGRPKSKPDVE